MITHNIEVYDRRNIYEFDNSLMMHYYPERIIKILGGVNKKCLELGIGNGYTVEAFTKQFNKYIVLEGDGLIINRFKKEFPDSEAEIIETYFEKWTTEERFDVIILGFVLEHVDDPQMIIKNINTF